MLRFFKQRLIGKHILAKQRYCLFGLATSKYKSMQIIAAHNWVKPIFVKINYITLAILLRATLCRHQKRIAKTTIIRMVKHYQRSHFAHYLLPKTTLAAICCQGTSIYCGTIFRLLSKCPYICS